VFLKDLEDFDVKKNHDLSKEGMREGKVMACTVVQEWKLVIGVVKKSRFFPCTCGLLSICFLILSTVKFKRGNFWGAHHPFVREGASRVICRSIIFWAAACGA
jgi:hypothetical protein